MQQDKESAWKEFEETGSVLSYLSYRGIGDTPRITNQTEDDPADAKKAPSMQG
ncbi:MAG: hypothetical protein IJB80_04220 [Clostridia bacterium]|nr:hypothetical protein [Clostridia bacterium]